MSACCRVNIHFCYNETNEIAKWDVKCDQQRVEWTDSFAKVRSLAYSGAVMQKMEPAIQERISLSISKGGADPLCRLRMYVMHHDATGRFICPPLEIVDEDLSLATLHDARINCATDSDSKEAVFDLLISNARVLRKVGNPLNKTKDDELLPTAKGEPACNIDMAFTFFIQKTNRNKEAPVLNERIFSFKQQEQGPLIDISDKDLVERHITRENLKSFGAIDDELLIQEYNTMKFLLKLVRGDVEPGNLLKSYPRRVLYIGMLDKLVNRRWSSRFMMIIPHRLYSFANDTGVERPRNVVPLRGAKIVQTEREGVHCMQIDHPSMASSFIFRVPDPPSDRSLLSRHCSEVSWALQQAAKFTKSSPLFDGEKLLSSKISVKVKNASEAALPLDQVLMFCVKLKVLIPGQRFDNGIGVAQQDLGYADEYMMQLKQRSDDGFDMIFSFKEKVNEKLLIFTGSISRVSRGATPDFYLEDIDPNQCMCVQVAGVDSKATDVVLVFQTSFDCDLFFRSIEAIKAKSMFDAALTPVPMSSRVLIDKCIAQKSESIGWGDRQLVLIPYKLMIYSTEKSGSSAGPHFPRNIISLKGAQVSIKDKEVHITISIGVLVTYSAKFKFANEPLALAWCSKVRMACAFETDSAVGGSPAGPQRVGYNDELPAPGVVIKQDDVFVEGIAHDRKKFSVCLRVAKAGHVSMLFFASDKRPSDADPMAGLIGGFILKRDEEGAASGTCALAKNPRGIFGYCLRCDFSHDPQTSSQDWELKTNKKIVLCFEQPEPRAHWLDAFIYSFRVPSIIASHAEKQGGEGHETVASTPQQGGNVHGAEAVAQETQGSSSAGSEAASAVEDNLTTRSNSDVDAAIASPSAGDQSAPPFLESSHESQPSSAGQAAGASLGSSAAAEAPPSPEHVEDHPACDAEQSQDDHQLVDDEATATLSADFEECAADEAYDSDAEVEQIIAEVKSGKRVTKFSLVVDPDAEKVKMQLRDLEATFAAEEDGGTASVISKVNLWKVREQAALASGEKTVGKFNSQKGLR